MCVNTILDSSKFILTLTEEIKLQLLLMFLACDTTYIPEVAASLGKKKVATEVCTDYLCLIPKCWSIYNEVSAMWLKSVSVWRVCKHLSTRVKNNVHRKLEASCSYAHRMLLDPASSIHIFRVSCYHCTWSEVCSTEDVTYERKPNSVLRLTSPLLLKTKNCLISKNVRILNIPSLWSHRSVEINDELILSSLASCAVIEINHVLVASVHEVNLHTCHSPIAVRLEDCVKILVDCKP